MPSFTPPTRLPHSGAGRVGPVPRGGKSHPQPPPCCLLPREGEARAMAGTGRSSAGHLLRFGRKIKAQNWSFKSQGRRGSQPPSPDRSCPAIRVSSIF